MTYKSKEKEAQKAYNRQRYLKHREQVLKRKKEYHLKNRKILLEKSRKYYRENVEKFKNYIKKPQPLTILLIKTDSDITIVVAKGKVKASSLIKETTADKIKKEIDRLLIEIEYHDKISRDYLINLLNEL